MLSLFAPKYRYASAFSPVLDRPLSPDEAVARLREDVFYHGHNHAYYRAKSERLAAEVAQLRAALDAAGVDPGAVPAPVPAFCPCVRSAPTI